MSEEFKPNQIIFNKFLEQLTKDADKLLNSGDVTNGLAKIETKKQAEIENAVGSGLTDKTRAQYFGFLGEQAKKNGEGLNAEEKGALMEELKSAIAHLKNGKNKSNEKDNSASLTTELNTNDIESPMTTPKAKTASRGVGGIGG